jgi:hypothetical protein
MKDRRAFLVAVASGGAGLSLMATAARAQSASPAAAPTPAAPASPFVKPSGKPPSAVALALAAGMRSFDPALGDAELATIAAGIDAMRDLGPQLNPKKKRLANGDQPVATFAATTFLA